MTDRRDDPESPSPQPGEPVRRRGAIGRFRDRFFGLSPRDPAEPTDRALPGLNRLSPQQASLATAGLELGGGILLFAAIGYGLDVLFGTFPVLLVVLSLLGMVGGLYRLIKAVQPPKG